MFTLPVKPSSHIAAKLFVFHTHCGWCSALWPFPLPDDSAGRSGYVPRHVGHIQPVCDPMNRELWAWRATFTSLSSL